jgi:hypothetical protein
VSATKPARVHFWLQFSRARPRKLTLRRVELEHHGPLGNHFLKSISSSEITTLTMIMVVNGKKNLNPGRSMMMSPGSRPSGKREIHGHAKPISTIKQPSTMRRRRMGGIVARPSRQLDNPSRSRYLPCARILN